MYRKGKKVDKTRKYTEAELRKICGQITEKTVYEILQIVYSLAIMTYEDLETKTYTVRGEKFYKKDADAFNKLLDKYAIDYANGDFKASEVKQYSYEALKGLYK